MTSFTFLTFIFLAFILSRTGLALLPSDPANRSPAAKAGIALLLCLSMVPARAASHAHDAQAAAAAATCAAELDRQVALARAGELQAAEHGLLALGEQCTQLPQIHQNLGSLAAQRGDWDRAIEQLEAAIALDRRTADTVEALREIRRWQAAQAYARALGEPQRRQSPPVPVLHDSRWRNSDESSADPSLAPRNEDALDKILRHWWTSTAASGSAAPEAQGPNDAPDDMPVSGAALPSSSRPASRPDWNAVARDIVFARQDAVALLRWHDANDVPQGRLLLLRPQGEHWTIYQEKAL